MRSRPWLPLLSIAALTLAAPVYADRAGELKQTEDTYTRVTTITSSINAWDDTQNLRLLRDGETEAGKCGTNACPGTSGSGRLRYKTFSFKNSAPFEVCYRVKTTESACAFNVQLNAYLNSFDPESLCTNFLSDTGVSGIGSSFTFSVPAGQTFIIAANEVSPETYCSSFTFELYADYIDGDFNLDRKADIVLRNYSTGTNALWLMNGIGYSSTVDLPALPNTAFRIEAVGDFNSDGHQDIVFQNPNTSTAAIWLMRGTTLQSVVELPALNWVMEGAPDINNDGKPDLLWRNYTNGQIAAWIMNGTTMSSIVDLPTVANPSLAIEGSGDFDGDGKTDLLFRNYSTGANAIWLMNGTTLRSVVDLPALSTAFYFEGTADFTRDGYTDILIRRYTNGQNAIWTMVNTSLSTIYDLPAIPDANIQFAGPR
jgi:hypothetical protein